MTTVTESTAGASVLDRYLPKAPEKEGELGKNAFLELMIAQLEHQDPLSPQENGEFIAQLAQFSQVESLGELQNSVGQMAGAMRSSLALQASTLVGRSVRVPTNTAAFDGENPVLGVAQLPNAGTAVRMRVTDAAGVTVRNVELGTRPGGELALQWDGRDDSGARLPAGRYSVRAEANLGTGAQALQVELNANVNSVSFAADGEIVLNVAGVGPVAMSDVREVH